MCDVKSTIHLHNALNQYLINLGNNKLYLNIFDILSPHKIIRLTLIPFVMTQINLVND